MQWLIKIIRKLNKLFEKQEYVIFIYLHGKKLYYTGDGGDWSEDIGKAVKFLRWQEASLKAVESDEYLIDSI